MCHIVYSFFLKSSALGTKIDSGLATNEGIYPAISFCRYIFIHDPATNMSTHFTPLADPKIGPSLFLVSWWPVSLYNGSEPKYEYGSHDPR